MLLSLTFEKDSFWNTSISCLIYLFIDLYCKKILAEKTKLQHDLQNNLEEKKQLEHDLSSYKKRLAKQNRTGKQMENGNPELKTNDGNTTLIFQNISCILKMRTNSIRYAEGTGLRCSRTLSFLFFLACVYGNTKDHTNNGSAATGPPCNDL